MIDEKHFLSGYIFCGHNSENLGKPLRSIRRRDSFTDGALFKSALAPRGTENLSLERDVEIGSSFEQIRFHPRVRL
jgi:hypothetical protein